MVSPLLLESLQRFIDALTPTLANLHPLTVLNHLHLSCVQRVSAANVLKTTENVARLRRTQNEQGTVTDLAKYEETIKTQFQAAIEIPRVNVTILQVSIVEEVISFSALDNIKDLTCVSLFSLCFDNISAKFHADREAHEVLQKFHRPSVVQTGSKKGANRARHFLGLHTNTNANTIRGEPVFVESCERQQQQVVFCLNVGKIHAQLRRLKNESSILEDAVITAIPSHCSKVLFTATKAGQQFRGIDYYMQPIVAENVSTLSDEFAIEDKLGFIMFESGLEGVSIKIVKKSQFEQVECDRASQEKAEVTMESQKLPEETEEKTQIPKFETKAKKPEDTQGNVSSCVIELKVVWFNFAAPPRAPITRKIDFTRLDWNLLSTVSPAINAWMNPSNRLAIRVVHMVRTMYRRSTAAVACLMAEAMDVQGIHQITKVRI